jgi:hypothetical protein
MRVFVLAAFIAYAAAIIVDTVRLVVVLGCSLWLSFHVLNEDAVLLLLLLLL